jgi:hypothetical protein
VIGTQVPNDVAAIHPRHLQIDECQVRSEGDGCAESRRAVVGDLSGAAQSLQKRGESVGAIDVVITTRKRSFEASPALFIASLSTA